MATRRDVTGSAKRRTAAASTTPAAPTAPIAKPKSPARKAAAPRKAGAPRKSSKAAPPVAPAKPVVAGKKPGAQALLRAGLKALGDVRNDVVKRQTNVIESLLGIGSGKGGAKVKAAAPARGFPGLDSFGIRKFEDVFDQRVATALQRLGMPSAQEIQALRDQMQRLLEHLERVESSDRKKR